MDRVMKQVKFMARYFGNFDREYIAKVLLLDMGLPFHMEGFEYLLCGAEILYKNPDASMTKHIYPAIAEICGGQGSHVEIAIRRAIWVAWRKRDEKWLDYFPGKQKPANHQVLSMLVELLTFWEACREYSK